MRKKKSTNVASQLKAIHSTPENVAIINEQDPSDPTGKKKRDAKLAEIRKRRSEKPEGAKIVYVHELTPDADIALAFIRKYGNPSHAMICPDDDGTFSLPCVIPYGECEVETYLLGHYLVIRPDKLTYLYTPDNFKTYLRELTSEEALLLNNPEDE